MCTAVGFEHHEERTQKLQRNLNVVVKNEIASPVQVSV